MTEQIPVTLSQKTVQTVLNETREGRQALQNLLHPLFVHCWTDVLNMVFEWFPHEDGDGSDNERAFKALRHRVLRVGNGESRQMSMILQDFAVAQLRTHKVEHRSELPQNGPFGLPENVQMPVRK